MPHGLSAHTPLARFQAQSRERPGLPAVVGPEGTVTYGELEARAQIVAEAVRRRVPPGAPVGLAVDRSVAALEAMLGILGAGSPYVPLDVSLPASRLRAIVDDVAPELVIVDQRNADRVPGDRPMLRVEGIDPEGVGAAMDVGAQEDDLAYILFTSGSTGVPKGVAMRHGALSNLMEWQVADPRLGRSARTLQFTPLIFDVSFQEITGCLATGGTLILVDEVTRQDPTRLLAHISEHRIERLYLPFVALQKLAEAAGAGGSWPTTLRDVVTAGEQLQITPALVELFRRLPDCSLHNHYGPCETHVVTAHVLNGDPAGWPELPPIGAPIPNVQVRVLSPDGEPVPAGDTGELYLGGVCHARGYLNQPAKTAERFVPDPFSDRPGARLYKTGDVGRAGPDGVLEWIGRNDHQVKVRGFRVELGEVEVALSRHPHVRQAVVTPRRRPDYTDLVAYLTVRPEEDVVREVDTTLDQWRDVWDRTYGDGTSLADPTFNIAGWNSSYTGEPLPEEDMGEWVEATVRRVAALEPRRVLEIGCGTGLLLFRLAPACEHFVGLDFSRPALNHVERHLDVVPGLRERVTLLHRSAHDLDDLDAASFDVVLMNSVTQHFPSARYLDDVLKACTRLLRPGGTLVVGDVTNRSLRRAFFSSVEVSRSDTTPEHRDIRENVHRRLRLDRELVVEPAFFDAWARLNPVVKDVEIQLKAGPRRNELTDFRYDVFLHGVPREGILEPGVVTWDTLPAEARSADDLVALACGGQAVRGVPNSRTFGPCRVAEAVLASETAPAAGLRHLLHERPAGLDPADVFGAAPARGAAIDVSPSSSPDRFDVWPSGTRPPLAPVDAQADLADYTSDPGRNQRAAALLPHVRAFLEEGLPEYMRPAAYVVLDSFPVTPTGKIDRGALPAPDNIRPELAHPFVSSRTPLERVMEAAWRDILGLDRVGAEDTFFELGGNSILILQLASRLKGELGREVPVVTLLEHPTIRALARHLDGGAEATVEEALSRGEQQRQAYGRRRPPPRRRPAG